MAAMTADQLADLWVRAGGNPSQAKNAAAVALAESSGNASANHVNNNGSVDIGLWQINTVHGSLASSDPLANARAAVSISKNGTTWSPWCTAYTDGACGTKGGTLSLTSGSPVAKILASLGLPAGAPGGATATGTGVIAPNGATGATSATGSAPAIDALTAAAGAPQPSWLLKYITALRADGLNTLNPVLNNLFYGAIMVGGIGVFAFGTYKCFTATDLGAGVVNGVKSTAKGALNAGAMVVTKGKAIL